MNDTLQKSLAIALGAALGANGRFWLGHFAPRLLGSRFPSATALVNLTGCFVMGLFMTLSLERVPLSPLARVFLFVGVLGGYTTFSAFGWETCALFMDGQRVAAFLEILLQVVGGLLAVLAGASLASSL